MTERSGFGLYVHWPFCRAKCPYCDFNSHVAASVDQSRWRSAMESEIRRVGRETEGLVLDTIFFGGGTPSLMEPETVARVIETARSVWTPSNDMEITLEANPTSVEASRFQGYSEAGVNRVSIGIQSLRDADLKRLGRLHSSQEAAAALEIARSVFDRVSFDLIYARQNQSLADWEDELSEALSLHPDHLSLYQLSIEDGTAFGDRFARGKLSGLPGEDLAADMFEVTQEITSRAGLPAYEISNHAKPRQESRHNLIYWRSANWAAVGPGAHGRYSFQGSRVATVAFPAPGTWLEAVEKRGSGEATQERLSDEEAFEERVMMGLRLREGVSRSIFSPIYLPKINALVDAGLVEVSSETLRATPMGRPVLNFILRQLLA